MGYLDLTAANIISRATPVASRLAETPLVTAQKIVADATKGKVHDIKVIDAKLAGITAKDPARGAEVRKAAETLLSPTEVGELRRAADTRTAIEAGQPVIITVKDGTKTDGFGVRISGIEPKYEPDKWNKGFGSAQQEYNNCYAYAVNDLSLLRGAKPQPGERANVPQNYFKDGKIDIGKLKSAIAEDGKTTGIKWLGEKPSDTLKAPKGSYIVALVVDNKDGIQDYHWYRHNDDGSWSGKGGNGPATNLDGSGKLIVDPRAANRFVGSDGAGNDLNYVKFVGYYAVTPGAQVGPKP
jgi:hypothetical protein